VKLQHWLFGVLFESGVYSEEKRNSCIGHLVFCLKVVCAPKRGETPALAVGRFALTIHILVDCERGTFRQPKSPPKALITPPSRGEPAPLRGLVEYTMAARAPKRSETPRHPVYDQNAQASMPPRGCRGRKKTPV
jgi:hypothetical protein